MPERHTHTDIQQQQESKSIQADLLLQDPWDEDT
jgi:hypothetical protein